MEHPGVFTHLYQRLETLPLIHSIVTFLAVWAIFRWLQYYRSWVDVPIIGDKGFLATRSTGMQWPSHSDKILQEGYAKHGDYAFQIRTRDRWEVCICDDEMVREYQALPDEIASILAVTEDLFQTTYTCPGVAESANHIPVPVLSKAVTWFRTKTQGTQSIYFQELVKEQEFGLNAEVDIPSNEMVDLDCLPVALSLMLRMIGRVLVGHPLCRDPDAISLFTNYGSAVPISGSQIGQLPSFLKPLLGPHYAASKMQVQLNSLIVDEIKRGASAKEDQMTVAQWMWAWVQRESPGEFKETDVAGLLISSIFGSVLTAGSVLTTTLYELSIRPDYVDILREEVNQSISAYGGMGKESIESMTKLDSFIKETMRLRNPVNHTVMHRVVKRDYTFKSGLKVPAGTFIFTPATALHLDAKLYDKPEEFNGLRFHQLGQETGKPNNYKIAGSSPKTRQFGDGRHSCPGRQLAADLLRIILANFLLNYDIQKCGDQEDYPSIELRRMSVKRRVSSV